jgi:hypothetical protein
MPAFLVSPALSKFLRQQELYIAIAFAVYATFWAISRRKLMRLPR